MFRDELSMLAPKEDTSLTSQCACMGYLNFDSPLPCLLLIILIIIKNSNIFIHQQKKCIAVYTARRFKFILVLLHSWITARTTLHGHDCLIKPFTPPMKLILITQEMLRDSPELSWSYCSWVMDKLCWLIGA